MTKRALWSALLGIAAALSLVACATTPIFTAGTYIGTGKGHGGDIKVAVTVSAAKVLKIELLQSGETAGIGDAAFKELSDRVMKANSANVDVVAGASESSGGILEAIKDALNQAGFKGAPVAGAGSASAKAPAKSYDVVIIGAGGAGLSAANAAAEAGVSVAVFEKMGLVGGNTLRATGGLNAAGTKEQAAAGIKDSVELFFQDTMKGGYNKNDPALVRTLAEQSAATVAWLESLGADLSDVGRLAGASVNRAHRPVGGAPVGPEVVKTLKGAADKRAGIAIFTGAKAQEILLDKAGAASGIRVSIGGKDYKVAAKAVILATGGFAANNEMVASYQPSLRGFATTNHSGAMGDGIFMAEKIGAALVDMKEIQTHPTYAPGKEMITEAVRGNGAILVGHEGKRFINELETRDVVSAAVLAQKGKTAYIVFDQSVRKSLKAIEDYVRMGIVAEGATPAELAAKIGVPADALAATLDRYNAAVAAKADPDFRRADMPRALATGPFYSIEITPAVHHTMGGVKIDTSARVISAAGKPIAGLWAAGEVTGGVHGGNRLGGNAVADITVFGRIAGSNAAAFVKK